MWAFNSTEKNWPVVHCREPANSYYVQRQWIVNEKRINKDTYDA